MILIFTHSSDLGADLVIRHLAKWGVRYKRVDTDHLGTRDLEIAYRDAHLLLRHAETEVDPKSVSAVWARRFTVPSVIETIDSKFQDFAGREFAYTLDAFIAAVPGIQINSIEADRTSGNRLTQAERAKKAGLLTPDTLVTQSADLAREFVGRYPKAITKAISYGVLDNTSGTHAHTALVGPDFDFSGLSACPAMFQECVPKRFEWRVTTVGDAVFAARTRAGAADNVIDWRLTPNVGQLFEAGKLPSDIESKLSQLCSASGLLYSAHDLIETPSGDFYFLETNPAGQWGWLEVKLGLSIGEAIASLLVSARIS